MKIKLLLIAFVICSCTRTKFSGFVHDFDTGKPIKNVAVNINGNLTTTDSTGYFEIEVNSNSNCIIGLKREGYTNKKVLRKPDYFDKTKRGELKKRTIYMFTNESDFSK